MIQDFLMYMKRYFTIALVAALLIGCLDDTNTVTRSGDKPIIEAYLAPGHPVSMYVYTEISYENAADSTSMPVNGLQIQITGNNGQSFKLTNTEGGIYKSSSDQVIGPAGTVYEMSFSYNGRTISGSTTIPPKPAGYAINETEIYRTQRDLSGGFGSGGFPGGNNDDNTAVEVTWTNPNQEYFFLSVQNIESSPEQITKLPDGNTLPVRGFTNEPVNGTVANISPQSLSYFGRYDVILYRVGADYAALYKSAGTTTQNLSTPPSSISNGLGIFTGINADTLLLNVLKK